MLRIYFNKESFFLLEKMIIYSILYFFLTSEFYLTGQMTSFSLSESSGEEKFVKMNNLLSVGGEKSQDWNHERETISVTPISTIPSQSIPSIPFSESREEDMYMNNAPLSSTRKKWISLSSFLTFMIPDCILSKNLDVRQAWREKVSIIILSAIISSAFLFAFAFLPKILCPDQDIFTWKEIYKSSEKLMVIKGKVFNVGNYAKIHPKKINIFEEYYGQDISYMFDSPSVKYKLPSNLQIYPELYETFSIRVKNDTNKYCSKKFCHPFNNDTFSSFYVGNLVLSYPELNENLDQNWLVLYNNIYNISNYVKYGQGVYPSIYDHTTVPRDMAYFLDERLNNTIMERLATDGTVLFERTFTPIERQDVINYLNSQFYIGTLNTEYNSICLIVEYLVYSVIILGASVLFIKFLAALVIMNTQYPECETKHVVISVPCYTESESALKMTINSIYDSNYPDEKKLIFMICDGVIKGKENSKHTSEIALNLFGRSLSEQNITSYEYNSIGQGKKSTNYIKIFCGWHVNNKHKLPYLILVKVGNRFEVNSERRGNRGKRDSQIITLKWLNRIWKDKVKYNNAEIAKNYSLPIGPNDIRLIQFCTTREDKCDFELQRDINTSLINAITKSVNSLGLNPFDYEFLQTIDADTSFDQNSEPEKNALKQLMYRMKDPKIIACCGETLVRNKFQSFTTAIQVYEYYINQMLNKAFESAFSSVTCLPGCFSFYRLHTADDRCEALIIDDELIEEYSNNSTNTLHMKNLLDLGEDRFFTTLISKYFPTWKIKFVPEAKCETNVPESISVLLSQRRRWINSTLHNLLELLLLERLCGCCCFSMKFVVIFDIMVQLCIPAVSGYVVFLIYEFIRGTPIPIVFYIAIACYCLPLLIPLYKKNFNYFFWFILYVIAFPFWTIILPVYALLFMDDFSWGNTQEIKKTEKIVKVENSSDQIV